jgi:hypothetical protein
MAMLKLALPLLHLAVSIRGLFAFIPTLRACAIAFAPRCFVCVSFWFFGGFLNIMYEVDVALRCGAAMLRSKSVSLGGAISGLSYWDAVNFRFAEYKVR